MGETFTSTVLYLTLATTHLANGAGASRICCNAVISSLRLRWQLGWSFLEQMVQLLGLRQREVEIMVMYNLNVVSLLQWFGGSRLRRVET